MLVRLSLKTKDYFPFSATVKVYNNYYCNNYNYENKLNTRLVFALKKASKYKLKYPMIYEHALPLVVQVKG